MCSAFLHGSEALVRNLSDVRQSTDWERGVAEFLLEPRSALVASITAGAVLLVEQVHARYDYLCTVDYAGRAV